MTQNGKMLTLLNIENGSIEIHYIMPYFSVCLKSLKIRSPKKWEKHKHFPEEGLDAESKRAANRNIHVTTGSNARKGTVKYVAPLSSLLEPVLAFHHPQGEVHTLSTAPKGYTKFCLLPQAPSATLTPFTAPETVVYSWVLSAQNFCLYH